MSIFPSKLLSTVVFVTYVAFSLFGTALHHFASHNHASHGFASSSLVSDSPNAHCGCGSSRQAQSRGRNELQSHPKGCDEVSKGLHRHSGSSDGHACSSHVATSETREATELEVHGQPSSCEVCHALKSLLNAFASIECVEGIELPWVDDATSVNFTRSLSAVLIERSRGPPGGMV